MTGNFGVNLAGGKGTRLELLTSFDPNQLFRLVVDIGLWILFSAILSILEYILSMS